MANKIVTSVSALVDSVITQSTDDVVCIDTRNSRIGVKKSNPLYEIDVSGTINCSILTISSGTFNTTISGSGISTNSINIPGTIINNLSITSSRGIYMSPNTITNPSISTSTNYITGSDISFASLVKCNDISSSGTIRCISGNFANLISKDVSCSSMLYVDLIRPFTQNRDISINGNLVIDGSLNSIKTTKLIVRNISGTDISVNGNVWIDGSLNIKGSVNGSASITGTNIGTGYINLLSDDRLKHNEQTIVNALLIIRQLNPQIYQKTTTFKELHYHGYVNEPFIIEAGLIAQEVEKIDELKFSVTSGNENTPYSLNYNSIFIYCLAALKELDNNVETIKNVLNYNNQSNNGTSNGTSNGTTNYDLINIINNQNNQIKELVNKIGILENRISIIERAF